MIKSAADVLQVCVYIFTDEYECWERKKNDGGKRNQMQTDID
jgi:hypothetical protein